MIEAALYFTLNALAVPHVGLVAVFLMSFISATLLPLGSEPVVFAAIKTNPALFWPVILAATMGNTLGGMLDYWIGYGARQTFSAERGKFWFSWLKRYGAKAMILAWLPIVGDPLCTLGGWLKLPFWPSVAYMAAGKFLRYLLITTLLLHVPAGFWRNVMHYLG